MNFARSETVYWDGDDGLERSGTIVDTDKYSPDVAVFAPKEDMTMIFEASKLRRTSKLVENYKKTVKTENTIYLNAANILNLLAHAGFEVSLQAKVSILRGSGSCNVMLVEEHLKIEWGS